MSIERISNLGYPYVEVGQNECRPQIDQIMMLQQNANKKTFMCVV